jgi:hypothetical protein
MNSMGSRLVLVRRLDRIGRSVKADDQSAATTKGGGADDQRRIDRIFDPSNPTTKGGDQRY